MLTGWWGDIVAWLRGGPSLVRALAGERRKAAELALAFTGRAERVHQLKTKVADERRRFETSEGKLVSERDRARRKRDEAQAVLRALETERAKDFRARKRLLHELAQAKAHSSRLAGQLKSTTALMADLAERVRAAASASGPSAASLDPQAHFELGEVFQLNGDVAMAVSCYRACGPKLDALVQRSAGADHGIKGPDFLVIGPPRSGTTWLKKRLSWHPEVHMLEHEQHYFAHPDQRVEAYINKFAAPEELMWRRDPAAAPDPSRRLFGEKSPRYIAMPEANIALCATLYPRARLICVVREPVARAWSELRHMGLKPTSDDADILRRPDVQRRLAVALPHGRYLENLSRWARHFPPEQILLLDLAELAADPLGAYRAALRHIGAEPFSRDEDKLAQKVGETPAVMPPPALLRALEEAYAGEPWDIPTLRRAMKAAAVGAEGAGPRRARRAGAAATASAPG